MDRIAGGPVLTPDGTFTAENNLSRILRRSSARVSTTLTARGSATSHREGPESPVTSPSRPCNEEVVSGKLCLICQRICRESQLLRCASRRHVHQEMSNDLKGKLEAAGTVPRRFQEEDEVRTWAERFSHHQSRSELELCGATDCHLCHLLIQGPWHGERQDLESPEEERPMVASDTGIDCNISYFDIRLTDHDSGQYTMGHPIVMSPGRLEGQNLTTKHLQGVNLDPPVAATHPKLLSRSTDSNATISIASSWIENCVSNHDKCHLARGSDGPTPTRVLEVRLTDYGGMLRLCECSDLHESFSFVTLSHCWGGANVPKLTQAEFRPFLTKGIELKDLPKTFRDAAIITSRLGYRYLWIDALCIIQDSLEDWRTESANMGKIYENSIFTIAALNAKDSQDGLFRDRNPLSHFPCRVDDEGTFEVNVHHLSDEQIALGLFHERSKCPLRQRGWIFQESILSPRTLYYGSEMIFWECHELQASESRPCGSQNTLDYYGPGNKTLLERVQRYLHLQQQQSRNSTASVLLWASQTWWHLISTYSRMSLTFGRDKLVAISGISTRWRGVTGWTYLAGLWRETLLFDLHWCLSGFLFLEMIIQLRDGGSSTDNDNAVTEIITKHKPSETYRAPSWSWASVDGPVNYLSPIPDHFEARASLVDAKIKPASEHDHSGFGDILGGWIKLRGFLRKAVRRSTTPAADEEYSMSQYAFSSADDSSSDKRLRIVRDSAEFDFDDIFCFQLSFETEKEPEATVGWKPSGEGRTQGLLLVPVGSNNFRRVGFFFEELAFGQRSVFEQGDGPQTVLIV